MDKAVARKVGAVLGALVVSGCCIPFPSTHLVTPPVTFAVTDGATAIPDARVIVVRYVYRPYFEPDSARATETRAGSDGRGAIARADESDVVFPLMMHGVPGYGWQICAEAAGRRSVVYGLPFDYEDSPVEVTLVLPHGSGPTCSEILGRGRLEVGESRMTPPSDVVAPAPGP